MPKPDAYRLTAALLTARRQGWAKYVRTPADERFVLAGGRYDPRRADHVADFFARFLRHSKGEWAGKPFELLPWQRDEVTGPLFGWVQPDGLRRYRRAYVEIPKKNGKSTLCAGLGLYLLTVDDEPGAEIYSAAADRDQASIVHGEAINMVLASPELCAALRINQHTKSINDDATRSWYRALSHRPGGKEGLNAHAIVCDELHIWRGRELWDTFRYAFRARRQPLLFVITTAGSDITSVCYEQHQYARAVEKDEIHDPRYFAYVKCAEPHDDPADPEVWKKCNPSYGITMNPADFAADHAEATKTPGDLVAWKRYSLNIWSTSTNPWLPAGVWSECGAEYTLDDLAGGECWAGLDLAKSRDTTALTLVFPDADEPETCWTWPFFWLPEGSLRHIDDKWPARRWAEAGLLELTPGEVCDYEFVRARLAELRTRFRIRGLAFDPYFAQSIVAGLQDRDGWPAESLIQFGQTITNFAEPTAEFERRILKRCVRHPCHELLTWQFGNVHMRTDVSGNIRPVKPERQDHRKIDGVVAAIMAFALLLRDEAKPKGPYERGGELRTL